jgi:hypothetical protein
MKVIVSRKGFDSAAGGVASPILSDGTMLSLPIPDKTSTIKYEDITLHGHPLGRVVSDLTKGKVTATFGAHLDPDLVAGAIPRHVGWRPLFGQCDAEQRVLEREGVGPGDLFLYFGWFRQAELRGGQFQYVRGAPDMHVLWGWLQIGASYKVGADMVPWWAEYHPHVARSGDWKFNTVYQSAEVLDLGGAHTGVAGAGVFGKYDDRLCLTATGKSRSIWSLPGWFFPADGKAPLGYHGDPRRWSRDGDRVLLQTVGRGQEFVLDSGVYPEVVGWAQALVTASTRTTRRENSKWCHGCDEFRASPRPTREHGSGTSR